MSHLEVLPCNLSNRSERNHDHHKTASNQAEMLSGTLAEALNLKLTCSEKRDSSEEYDVELAVLDCIGSSRYIS